MLRRLIRVNEEIANACYQHKESVEEIMNTTEKRIFDVIQKKSTDEYVPIQDVVLSVIDKIEAAARHKGTVTGLATGFYEHSNFLCRWLRRNRRFDSFGGLWGF